jgi:hypothetical protein
MHRVLTWIGRVLAACRVPTRSRLPALKVFPLRRVADVRILLFRRSDV